MNAWLARGLVALALAAAAALVAMNTHWVQETVHVPPHGAALTDPYYLLRPIVEAAGSTLHAQASLDPLPPDGATLLLDSSTWNVFAGRVERLEAWVDRGGHLVLEERRRREAAQSLRWIPVARAHATRPGASGAQAPEPRRSRRLFPTDPEPVACATFREGADAAPAFQAGRNYIACGVGKGSTFHVLDAPLWTLALAPSGAEGDDAPIERDFALRVAHGRGDVTLLSAPLPDGVSEDQEPPLLRDDTALVVVAALGLRPQRPFWIVEDEAREDLLPWLWERARAPLLLALAALVLAIWRAVPRFGPPAPAFVAPRRSMAEQVRGIGQFLARREPAALHAATRAALEADAQRGIAGWPGMDEAACLAALGRRAGVTPDALAAAWRPAPTAAAAQWAEAVIHLERVRRAL